MGRRKISIQPITDERNRKVTFVKRKAGLFKKAHELAVLCQVDLAVIILSNNNSKFYEYGSVKIDDLLKNHSSKSYSHDVKAPNDYGDYELVSRVHRNGSKGHTKQQNSVSLSIEGDVSSEEDEEEDDDEEDDHEPEQAPSAKKRRTVNARSRAKQEQIESPNLKQAPVLHIPSNQMVIHNNTLAGPPMVQHQQPIMFQQHQQGNPHYQMRPRLHSNYLPGQQSDEIGLGISDPRRGSNFSSQQQPYTYSNFPFSPGTPSSQRSELLPSISTPVVPNSNSPYDHSRSRSLNNNMSKRPVLRVQIPEDSSHPKPNLGNGDSAITLTAAENSTSSSEPKDENPLSATSVKGHSSADSNKPTMLDTSNRSTPISATLPTRGFALPPPQSSQHVQYQQGFKTMAGEQTPLTGGLPSKYVPDLFPSPSNFYSNEWNIPFGSGTTPYPNSAGPHQLPNVNPGNSGPPRLTKLPSLNADMVDSPLQHFSKDLKDKRQGDTGNEGDSSGKKINFKGS